MSHGTSFQNIDHNSKELPTALPPLTAFPYGNNNGVFIGTLYTRATKRDCVN